MAAVRPQRGAFMRTVNTIGQAFVAAVGRLDKSFSPSLTISRLRAHKFTSSDSIYIFHIISAVFWLTLMEEPSFPLKLVIPTLYAIALLIPFTSQFFIPATPVFEWLLTYYTSRFIPTAWRPTISVSLLPTLESVLYGANISDILTRFTHPALDIIAWLPYGVGHFLIPFVVAAFVWLFRPKEVLYLWARTFGYLNLLGVVIQIMFPCSAPWYELIYGLTPANYTMKGSPGGLARIDALFNSHGYTTGFSNAPVVFGAFPSLHAGCATIEALFLSHFFPQTTKFVWAYTGVLYWATMYLTHHYLIDVVGGACLATACFYLFLPDEFRSVAAATAPIGGLSRKGAGNGNGRSKYEIYDLETPRGTGNGNARGMLAEAEDFEVSEGESDEGEVDITYRSPNPNIDTGKNSTAPSRGGFGRGVKGSHRHTASIASLIRGEERGAEDGWSPVAGAGFVLPPAMGKGGSREREDR